MNRIDAGHLAAQIADALVDDIFENEHADTTTIQERARLAFFFVVLPNGQRFRVAVEEA